MKKNLLFLVGLLICAGLVNAQDPPGEWKIINGENVFVEEGSELDNLEPGEANPYMVEALPGTTLISFDDVVAPCFFSSTVPLSTEYSVQGVTFSGSGFSVLDECSNFGVSGYSAPNFLCWNSNAVVPPVETMTFSPVISNVSFNVAHGHCDPYDIRVEAFDNVHTSLGVVVLTLSRTVQTINLPYSGIAEVGISMIYTGYCAGIIDDLMFETCPEDIVVDNDPDACGAIVDYPIPSGLLVTGLASGSFFPVGTTLVEYSDPACSFNVTVVDAEAPTISCPVGEGPGLKLFGTLGYGPGAISTLVEIDPATGAIIETIGPIGYGVNGLAYDATNGKLYGGTPVHDPSFHGLIEIDMTTGVGTPIGAPAWGLPDIYMYGFPRGLVTNITVNSSGQMFGWTENGDDLVSIDKSTGIATVIDSSLDTQSYGLAFNNNDDLYLINLLTHIYEINTLTGAYTHHGSIGTFAAHHGVFHPATDQYYGLSQGSPRILLVCDLSIPGYSEIGPVGDLHTLAFVDAPAFERATDAGLCTYSGKAGEFDPVSFWDNCPITPTYVLSGATTGSGSASLNGVALNFGITWVTWTVDDGVNPPASCSFAVDVNEVTTVTEVTALPNPVQYSDEVTLTAVVTPWDCGLVPCTANGEVDFSIGIQNFDDVPLIGGVAEIVVQLCGDFNLEQTLGTFPVEAVYTPGDCEYYQGSDDETTLTIDPEDACGQYSGVLVASTSDPMNDNFKVVLAATIKELPDGNTSCEDITKAEVNFKVDGSIVNPVPCPVGLIDPEILDVGTAVYEWEGILPPAGYDTYEITIEIVGYYTGRDCVDPYTPVTISRPMADFATGGGFLIVPEEATGTLVPDEGSKNNFGFNIKWNKTMKNLQGNVNTILRRTEEDDLVHNWKVKANKMMSLTVDGEAKKAVFTGKASIMDVSDLPPEDLLEGDGNAIVQIEMTDVAEPGKDMDLLGITVWNKKGGVYYSSNWPDYKTIPIPIAQGNLAVHSGREKAGFTITESGVAIQSLNIYPNPFSERTLFEIVPATDSHAKLDIYSASGQKLATLLDQNVTSGQEYRLEYDPGTIANGIIFYTLTIDNEVKTGKLIYRR